MLTNQTLHLKFSSNVCCPGVQKSNNYKHIDVCVSVGHAWLRKGFS